MRDGKRALEEVDPIVDDDTGNDEDDDDAEDGWLSWSQSHLSRKRPAPIVRESRVARPQREDSWLLSSPVQLQTAHSERLSSQGMVAWDETAPPPKRPQNEQPPTVVNVDSQESIDDDSLVATDQQARSKFPSSNPSSVQPSQNATAAHLPKSENQQRIHHVLYSDEVSFKKFQDDDVWKVVVPKHDSLPLGKRAIMPMDRTGLPIRDDGSSSSTSSISSYSYSSSSSTSKIPKDSEQSSKLKQATISQMWGFPDSNVAPSSSSSTSSSSSFSATNDPFEPNYRRASDAATREKNNSLLTFDQISKLLSKPPRSVGELLYLIQSMQPGRVNLLGLRCYLEKFVTPKRQELIMRTIVPHIQQLALQLPKVLRRPLPLLRAFEDAAVSMTNHQIACLLAHAFFGSFPRRPETDLQSGAFIALPSISFIRLFSTDYDDQIMDSKAAKLDCIFHYFERTIGIDKRPPRVVTFHRQAINDFPAFSKMKDVGIQDLRIKVHPFGTIEDSGKDMLGVDFANKRLGGGVLGSGLVQEEILFLIFPEMIISRLFIEQLEEHEAVFMLGCERFSNYTGYSTTFLWDSNFVDDAENVDNFGRIQNEWVAIDAMDFAGDVSRQYQPKFVRRELRKAYAGFLPSPLTSSNVSRPLATGNWGCGAFLGEHTFKALIQVAAAASAGREELHYFAFENDDVIEGLEVFTEALEEADHISVADLVGIIHAWANEMAEKATGHNWRSGKDQKSKKGPNALLFAADYIRQVLSVGDTTAD